MYWSEKYGAYETWGSIGQYYESIGGTSSKLGFPISSEKDVLPSSYKTAGVYQRFEGGVIFWSETYGAVPVVGPISLVYDKFSSTRGKFGFPISPEVFEADHPERLLQAFEGGVICIEICR